MKKKKKPMFFSRFAKNGKTRFAIKKKTVLSDFQPIRYVK